MTSRRGPATRLPVALAALGLLLAALFALSPVRAARLTSNSGGDSQPASSPSGKRIAVTSRRDGLNEIYVMRADGSHQRRHTHGSVGKASTEPVFSPSGKRIAFTIWYLPADNYEI